VRSHETGEVIIDVAGTVVEARKVYHLVIYGVPGSTDTPLTSTILAADAPVPVTPTPTS
jgi:hypothetical protein